MGLLYVHKIQRLTVSLFLQIFFWNNIVRFRPNASYVIWMFKGSLSVYVDRKHNTKSNPAFLDEGAIQLGTDTVKKQFMAGCISKNPFRRRTWSKSKTQMESTQGCDVVKLRCIIPLNVNEDIHLKHPPKSLFFWL